MYESWQMFMLAVFVVLIALLVVGLVMYIITAVGLYRIAKARGEYDKAILAWIPAAQTWLIGYLACRNKPDAFLEGNSFAVGCIYLALTFICGGSLFVVPMSFLGVPLFVMSFSSLISLITSLYVTACLIDGEYDGITKWVLAFFSPFGIFMAGMKTKNSSWEG